MLEVRDGKIFVEGVETIDAELIGMAFKDYAEILIESGYVFYSKGIYPVTEESKINKN